MKAVTWILLLAVTSLFAAEPSSPVAPVAPAAPAAPAAAPAAADKEKPVPRTADPESEAAIEGYLKAIGGRDALLAIEDRYDKFEVARHSATGKTPALFERYMKRPNKVREDWDVGVPVGDQKLEVLQTYDGKEAWTRVMGKVSPLEGNMIYMLVWDKHIDDFFMNWKRDGYSLKYRSAEGDVNKEPCHVIDVYTATGTQEARYFFSKKTNLLLKKQWRADSQEGPVRSELLFTEYRRVNNPKAPDKPIQFPFKHETLQDGTLTMEREYLEVRLNSGLSDEIFGRPPGELWTGRVEPDKKDDDKGGETPKKDKEPPWKDRKRIVPKGAETPPAGEGSTPPKPEGDEKK
jgi:hypothetical protein